MKSDLVTLLDDCSRELNDIRRIISSLPPLDKEKAYLTKYALIKACGTAELVYRSIVADYFTQFGIPQIDTYLDTTIRSGPMSAKYENMCALLGKFDKTWEITFKQKIASRSDGQIIIQASNSLVNNRHSFAHGSPPSATFEDIALYYTHVRALITEFDAVVA